jgi:hypothetical protein
MNRLKFSDGQMIDPVIRVESDIDIADFYCKIGMSTNNFFEYFRILELLLLTLRRIKELFDEAKLIMDKGLRSKPIYI